MKKLLLLAIAMCLVAGAAFAETDPTFSGTFSTYWAYSFAGVSLSDDNSLGMKIDLGATIDEFNTVSVSVGLADAMYWDDVYDDDVMQSTVTVTNVPVAGVSSLSNDEIDNRGNYLRMDGFTLTTDLTGALGVEAPVSVTTQMGDFAFGTVNVANVAPKSTDVVGGSGADGGIGIGLSIGIMDMVTIGTVLYPVNAFEDKLGETGVTLQVSGIAGMIDFAAFFMTSEYDLSIDPWNIDGDPVDDEGMNMGVSVAVAPIDGLKIGLGFHNDMTLELSQLQADVAVSMIEGLDLGLSYAIENISSSSAIDPAHSFMFSASYAVLDNLSFYGAIGMPLFVDTFDKTSIKYDFGLTTSLAALAIQVGVSNNLDYMAPKDDFDDVLFVKFSTSF